MRPGARRPPLDAVLWLSLAVLCGGAAVSEGGVFDGESGCYLKAMTKIGLFFTCPEKTRSMLHDNGMCF